MLCPDSRETTRLVVRERYSYTRCWTALLVEPVRLISFLMSQKMLRGIRARARRWTRGRALLVGADDVVLGRTNGKPRPTRRKIRAAVRDAPAPMLALLRWWRFLAAIEVDWNRAGRVEVRDFVLWMRFVAQPKYSTSGDAAGYAPATINHNLAVLKSFYGDRIESGRGPLVNPVPDAEHRQGRRSSAHHNPIQPHDSGQRAALRQRVPDRIPRALPDRLFDALFAVVGCDRDRALLAFYVGTGARASELLCVTIDLVDPGTQRIPVRRRGASGCSGFRRRRTRSCGCACISSMSCGRWGSERCG